MVYVWFVVVSLIWGGSFILMKKAALVFGPMTIGAGRVIGAAIFLGVLLGVAAERRKKRTSANAEAGRRWSASWTWSGLGALGFLTAIGFVYPFVMQPYLIGKLGQSGFIGMMVSLVPLLTIGVSVLMLGVWPSGRQWVGVLAGLAAMPVLFGVGREFGVGAGDFALAATVPMVYATANTWVKKRLSDWRPAVLTASACGLAGLVLLPMGMSEPVRVDGDSLGGLVLAVGAVLVLGVVGTGVATVLFYRMVQQRGPLFAGMVTYVVPVEALLLGALDGERVTAAQVVALAVILGSVALVQWPVRRVSSASAPAR